MALLTMTWNKVGPIVIGSGSNVGRTVTKNEVMGSLNKLINSSSYWSVETFDVTGSLLEAMVLAPTASSPVADMRILVTGNATGSTDFWGMRTNTLVESDTNNQIQVGLCPDINENGGGSYTAGHFLSDIPFGTDVRWSKYWSAGDPELIDDIELVYIIESIECLWIGFSGRRTAQHGALLGPFGVSFDDGSGETDRRVFGMMCSQGTAIQTAFHGATTQFGGHSATANTNHAGFFTVSGSTPNGPSRNMKNIWDCTPKLASMTVIGQLDVNYGYMTTSEENFVGVPVMFVRADTPTRLVAMSRQLYMIQDVPAQSAIVTGTNGFTTVGYSIGNDSLSLNDAYMFGNV